MSLIFFNSSNDPKSQANSFASSSAFSTVLLKIVACAPLVVTPYTAALAAPPAPINATFLSCRVVTVSIASTTPSQSVLLPVNVPSLFSIVFTAPIFFAVSSTTSKYFITVIL